MQSVERGALRKVARGRTYLGVQSPSTVLRRPAHPRSQPGDPPAVRLHRTACSAWAIDCPVGPAVQAAQLRRGFRAALPRVLRAFLLAPAAWPAHVRLLCPPWL